MLIQFSIAWGAGAYPSCHWAVTFTCRQSGLTHRDRQTVTLTLKLTADLE